MPKRKVVAVPRTAGQQTFEFVSYGRKGPSGARRLSPGQMEQVARTVAKTPEVMVKVSGGARDAGGAQAHFDYIDRHGKLDIETDEGREITDEIVKISEELYEDMFGNVLSATEKRQVETALKKVRALGFKLPETDFKLRRAQRYGIWKD